VRVEITLVCVVITFGPVEVKLRVEITLERVENTPVSVIFTRIRVKLTLVCVEINLVRVEITLSVKKYTLRVEITLCVSKSHSAGGNCTRFDVIHVRIVC
jgi:hypothetical protein